MTTATRLPIWLLSVLTASAAPPARAGDRPPGGAGRKADLPTLRDARGRAFDPYADPGRTAVVVAFLSFDCPVARAYVEPLGRLAAEYGPKGVAVVGVVPTDDTPAQVAERAAEFKAAFPVFADPGLAAADALKATHTPEAFVLDAGRVVRYRGRIDDRYTDRLKLNARITRHDLRDAVEAVLAGRPVEPAATRPVGCEIARPDPAPKAAAGVTFYKDVLPILQARCQECHRTGEVGPFSLTTYRQAAAWAGDIKAYTRDRKMPPWKPVTGFPFQHDRRLPAEEIATLAAWADGGAPAGDPKDAPPARRFATGWALGEPDLVLTADEDVRLGATGPDHFRCVVLPTGLGDDRMVVAYEVRPGNPAVVHHSVNYFDASGTARKLAAAARADGAKGADSGPGYESPMGIGFTPKDPAAVGSLGGWTPGMRGVRTPAGTGMPLPKGADVVLQLHYHRDGKPATDRTSIGLYFAKGAKPLQPLKTLVVPGVLAASDGYRPFAAIPAGHRAYRVAGKVAVGEDCTVYQAMPHMHMLGKRVRITMTPPGGAARTVVAIDDWDYNWQEVYHFARPEAVKAGTVFTIEAEFDNSAANRHNPFSPPRPVARGDGTTDEMLFGFLRATSAGPGELKVRVLKDPADYRAK